MQASSNLEPSIFCEENGVVVVVRAEGAAFIVVVVKCWGRGAINHVSLSDGRSGA